MGYLRQNAEGLIDCLKRRINAGCYLSRIKHVAARFLTETPQLEPVDIIKDVRYDMGRTDGVMGPGLGRVSWGMQP